ncbi:nuclear transcription factor Y subunit gamma [Cucumis melo var. makuwa]|uniref:Nuclear transcription factor Y subunit gamma n=1 Tax=Cucumis melo var. makuwa TaxID=1194695 RepID=A0A5A7UEU0_CUCMM|nr:nuclear transcription factor Y subunit gamma [Cucumis melo var. makuwa]
MIDIAVLEEQKNEAAENEAADDVEDEAIKSNDVEPSSTVATKGELQDEKPDINDVPMEESQDNDHPVRQDLNESTLDLSLNLNALDDGGETSSKADHIRDGKRKG